jgi:hypothetical protein
MKLNVNFSKTIVIMHKENWLFHYLSLVAHLYNVADGFFVFQLWKINNELDFFQTPDLHSYIWNSSQNLFYVILFE